MKIWVQESKLRYTSLERRKNGSQKSAFFILTRKEVLKMYH